MTALPLITGTVIHGDGRGGPLLSTPTLNIDPSAVPQGIEEGVYAALVKIDDEWLLASVHYGTRPTFGASLSFEAHVLDRTLASPPATASVQLLKFLRPVRKFASATELKAAIDEDIRQTRQITAEHSA